MISAVKLWMSGETLAWAAVSRRYRPERESLGLPARFDPAWPGVAEWIEQSRDSLSLIASAIAALLDPDVIVLGGRIPRVPAKKLIPAIEVFDDARRQEPRPLPRVMLSQMQVDACAIGAAMLPLEQRFYSSML